MFWWKSILVLVLCAALAAPSAQAGGARMSVISVNGLGDDTAGNGNCTLREAILSANRNTAVDGCPAGAGIDNILLPAGTIKLTIAGATENESLTGDLDIRESVVISGAGIDATIIDANDLDRVFDIYDIGNGMVEIANLTIQGGLLGGNIDNYEEDQLGSGGGVRVQDFSSTLKLNRVRVINNYVDEPVGGDGAGVYSEGRLEVHNSIIEKNDSARSGGGISARRELLITDSYIEDNFGYGAAALMLYSGVHAVIQRTDFYGNHCGPAGWMIDISQNAEVTMEDFRVEYSDCEEATIKNSGSLTLKDGVFSRNNMSYHYGLNSGVIFHSFGNLLVKNTHFINNNAAAAILIKNGYAQVEESLFNANNGTAFAIAGGSARMINATISSTHLTDKDLSAGIMVEDGFLALESVTLANLQGGKAALQVDGGSVTVHNTLMAYNSNVAGQWVDCTVAPGTTVSAGYNLISVRDGCGWRAAEGDLLGTRAAPLDPRLGPLTDNEPGRTQTQPLKPGSPAINAADPDVCPAIDQRGVTRPQGPRCDIGAHEALAGQPIDVGYPLYMPVIQR